MNKINLFLIKRIQFLAMISLFALILGQVLGQWWWFAELFSHFVPWYAIIFVLATIWAQSWRKRLIWGLCALGLMIWLWLPWQIAVSKINQYNLLWYNVNLDNPNPEAETTQILQAQPDVLALAEIDLNDARWQDLQTHYPHGCIHQEDSPFALAVWAREPLRDCRVNFVDGVAWIRAELADNTAIYALHPPPPISGNLASIQKKYLIELAKQIQNESEKVVVVGDLNATPFSPVFRQFVSDANVVSQMPNYMPTWRLFGLHIDHVLTRNVLAQTYALQWGDSDHRAVMATW